MNSIASRIVITSVALVLCTAATIGAIQYNDFTKDHLAKRQEQLMTLVEREAQYLKDITENARRNAMFLSETPPIQGLVRAHASNGKPSFKSRA